MEWKNLEKDILSAGGEICGITSWKRGRERETWWWNVVIQQRLMEKMVAYKRCQRMGKEVDRETYKDRKRVTRREIAIAKRGAWEECSRNLNIVEGRGKMFIVAKQTRKNRRDVEGTNFIKSDTGEIKVEVTEVCGRWREYFEVLLNGENESNFEVVEAVEGPLYEITEQEVEKALKGMKNDRAAVPSGLTSDMLKYAGCTGVLELLRVF